MARYRTDFREYTLSVAPSDWSQPWHAFGSVSVVADATASGGRVLALSGTNNVRKAITWNKVNADAGRATCSILWKWSRRSGTHDTSEALGRASGDDASETGYVAGRFSNTNGHRVVTYDSASSDISAASDPSITTLESKWWSRVEMTGTTIRIRSWADGDPEPSTWAHTHTSSVITAAGQIGLFQFLNSTMWIEVFAVGTGGDAATLDVVPETAITLGAITPSDNSATVAFSTLDLYATDVEYRLNGGSWVSAGTTSSPITINALTPGTTYNVELRAANAAGGGAASSVGEIVTTGTAPTNPPATAPTIGTITPGTTSASVALTGIDADATDLEYRLDETSWVSASTITSPITVTGLAPATTYSLEVRAVNAIGEGPASAPSEFTTDVDTASAPTTAPTVGTITPSVTTADVAFTGFDVDGTALQYRLNSGTWVTAASIVSPLHVTGLAADTAYTIELRATNVAGSGPASSLVGFSTTAEPPPPDPGVFALIHDLDAGNINPTTAVLTDGATSTPSVSLDPRDKHVHWFFGLSGVDGKRPIITVDNGTRQNSNFMESGGWSPVYSYDQVTWQSFDAGFTALTSPTRVQFQHSTAFTADVVYIADHPVFRSQDWATIAATLNADVSGVVHPSSVADVNGVIGTTPAELDDLGRSIGGNTMWGFRLEDESLTTTDGGPRRELIITGGTHSGEIIDGWYLKGMVDWYLNGSGTAHTRFRRNFRILTYFSITPNGRKGGEWRSNFERSGDPNRNWSAFTLYETTTVRDALLADVERGDVHIDLHSASNSFKPSRIFTMAEPTTEETDRYNALKAAFDAIDSETLDLVPIPLSASLALTTANGWTRATFGSFSYVSEPGTRRSASIARYGEVGAHHLEAIAAMDEANLFYTPPSLPAAARNYFLRRRRLQRSTP